MIRTSPLKRTSRVGRASAQRRRQGGKQAQGRPSETVAGYAALTARLIARSGGYCEIHGRPEFGSQVCHVVARSQGGADTDWNTYWGCARANLQQMAAFARGRLMCARVIKHGVVGIEWELVKASGKLAYRLGQYTTLAAWFIQA